MRSDNSVRAGSTFWTLVLLLCVASANVAAAHRVRLTVQSEYQPGSLFVDVLTPDRIPRRSRLKVVYLLPVEPLNEHHYGSALDIVGRLALQNKYHVIFVAPTFAQMPWYTDHPSDSGRRHESYFIKAVLPLIEKRFPVMKKPQGRLLLGFSKSGWGAYSLVFRHPELFGGAVAWDAPLARLHPDAWEMPESFMTQENFDRYCVFSLLRGARKEIGDTHKLILLGYGLFKSDMSETHALMTELGIKHVYSNDHYYKHAWDTGWLPNAVSLLLSNKNTSVPTRITK
jgi:hypothetical protein